MIQLFSSRNAHNISLFFSIISTVYALFSLKDSFDGMDNILALLILLFFVIIIGFGASILNLFVLLKGYQDIKIEEDNLTMTIKLYKLLKISAIINLLYLAVMLLSYFGDLFNPELSVAFKIEGAAIIIMTLISYIFVIGVYFNKKTNLISDDIET